MLNPQSLLRARSAEANIFIKSTDQLVEKHIDIGACTVSYLQSGELSEATPVVFLHGWGISAQPYREFLNLLAQYHPVIAPDLPSFAGSSYLGFLESYGRYAEILTTFLDRLNLDRVHLVGHSFGGGIAIAIAAVQHKRVQSLTLIDTTGVPIGSIVEVALRRAIEMPLQINLPKFYLQFVEIPRVFSLNLLFNAQNVIQSLWLSIGTDLRPLLSLIQAPCLLLWSKLDLTTPLSIAQELQHKIPNAQLVVVEEGFHEWALLYPEKLTTQLINFLNHIKMIDAGAK